MDDLARYTVARELDVVIWLSSGIGSKAGPEGGYTIYSPAMQQRLASFAREGRYVP